MDITRAVALVDERMAQAADEYAIPAIAYGLVLGGELVHAGAVAAEGERPPTRSSAFRIASMTKSFTAATVLALRDRGVLALDDPVGTWLPWAAERLGQPASGPQPTIRHLLTMTAGFPTDDPWGDRQESLPLADFDALVARGLSACRPPGLEFEYANLGYALLGRVIAQATDADYRQVVRDTLLVPLGMERTAYDVDGGTTRASAASPDTRVMTGFHPVAGGLVPEPATASGAFSPMGGLWSTVEDLARWIGFLEAAWSDDPSDTPLSRWSRREMQRPHILARVEESAGSGGAAAHSYGMGLHVSDDTRLGRFVHHSGGYPGFGSHLRWHPDTRWGIVALGNRTYAPLGKACPPILEEIVADEAAQAGRARAVNGLWPRTREAMAVAESLLAFWDDGIVDEWGAMNLDLDQSRAERRAHWQALGHRGPFHRDDDAIEVRSPAHVRWRAEGRSGDVWLEVLLTPESRPRIQTLAAYGERPIP